MIQSKNLHAWPTIQDYDRALQNARMTTYDIDIKYEKPVQDASGLLHLNMSVGKYTCVYKCGNWVVKCFTGIPPSDIRERYQTINAYLNQYNHFLPFLIPQMWVERAIHINGKDWPFIKAIFVKHIPLGDFLAERHSDQSVVAALAKQFFTIIATFEMLHIAHGDLDNTNLLVCGIAP